MVAVRSLTRDALSVVGSFLALGLAVVPVAVAADALWPTGLVHAVVQALAAPVGGNLDVPVVAAIGALTGFLFLFTLDGTKRIQAPVVASTALAVFLPVLSGLDRILGAVTRFPLVFTGAFVLAIVGGAAQGRLFGAKTPSGLVNTLKWIQFPVAAAALFYAVAVLSLVTAGQYLLAPVAVHEAARATVSEVAPAFTVTANPLVVVVATLVLVFSLAFFTAYEHRQRVVTVAPDDAKYDPYVIGGLYALVKDRGDGDDHRHGFSIETGRNDELTGAMVADSLTDLNDKFVDPPVSFGWLERGLLSRSMVVAAEGWTAADIVDSRVASRRRSADKVRGRLARLGRRAAGTLEAVVPSWLPVDLRYTEGSVLNRIDHADTVLLLMPTPNGDDVGEFSRLYADLCEAYATDPDTDVLLVPTEAYPVAEQWELAMTGDALALRVSKEIGADDPPPTAVTPVDRFNADEPVGFEALIERLTD